MPLFQSIGETLGLFSTSKSKNKKSSSRALKGEKKSSLGKYEYSSSSSTNSSLADRLQTQRMSPNTRTKEWLEKNSPEENITDIKSCETPTILRTKEGRITKKAYKSKSKSKSKSNSKSSITDYEGSSTSPMDINPKIQPKSSLWSTLLRSYFKAEDIKTGEKDAVGNMQNDYNMEGSTLVDAVIDDEEASYDDGPSNYEGQTLLIQDNYGDLKLQDDSIDKDKDPFEDFTDQEYFLFHKLNARGYEPILHSGWTMDFDMLPAYLFTRDPKQAYINAVKAPEYHAQKALLVLFDVGQRARDASIQGIHPEKSIGRYLNDYFAWTMRDAGLKKVAHIPILTITVAHPGEPTASVVSRCTDRMHDMGRRYREAWRVDDGSVDALGVSVPRYERVLPTIFGIIVKSTGVGFITYDAGAPGKAVRNMGVWDLAKVGQDVWHAFAIAIFMICARNYLLRLEKDGMLGEQNEDSDDPDA